MDGISSSSARRLRGGADLPATPAFKDVFVKSGAGAGLYVCLVAGSWTGPFDASTVGDGDVQGPASSTDNAITRFDSTSGKVIQNSLVTIDDSGSVDIPTGQTYKINNVALAKGDVGLGNVDNTSDANKPVSSAAQTALDAKEAVANKSLDVTADGASDTKYPSVKAVKDYVDASGGGASPILASYLDTTITYNDIGALANTDLSVTVEAGGEYQIELRVFSVNTTQGLRLDFAGTATQTNFIGEWSLPVQGNYSQVTAAGTDYFSTAADGAVNIIYTFTGSMEVNAGGTFLLRGAQNAADASNTTILRGSTLILTKLN